MALNLYTVKMVVKIEATDEKKVRQIVATLMDTKVPESWNPVKSFVCKVEKPEEEEELVN